MPDSYETYESMNSWAFVAGCAIGGVALIFYVSFIEAKKTVYKYERIVDFVDSLMKSKETPRFRYKPTVFKFSGENDKENLYRRIFELSISLEEKMGYPNSTQDIWFFESVKRFVDKNSMKDLDIVTLDYVFEKDAKGYFLYVKFIKLSV